MVNELVSFSLFLVAALAGTAKFREHKSWDRVCRGISHGAQLVGTALLVFAVSKREYALFVPLSLLLLMLGSRLLYQGHVIAQMLALPLVIGELLMSMMFHEIRELFATPTALFMAFIFHGGFFWLVLKLDSDSERLNSRFHLPVARFSFLTKELNK